VTNQLYGTLLQVFCRGINLGFFFAHDIGAEPLCDSQNQPQYFGMLSGFGGGALGWPLLNTHPNSTSDSASKRDISKESSNNGDTGFQWRGWPGLLIVPQRQAKYLLLVPQTLASTTGPWDRQTGTIGPFQDWRVQVANRANIESVVAEACGNLTTIKAIINAESGEIFDAKTIFNDCHRLGMITHV
jgi:hypothetical protein